MRDKPPLSNWKIHGSKRKTHIDHRSSKTLAFFGLKKKKSAAVFLVELGKVFLGWALAGGFQAQSQVPTGHAYHPGALLALPTWQSGSLLPKGVWGLGFTAQKPINRPGCWRGKVSLFQLPATEVGREGVGPWTDVRPQPPLTPSYQHLK